MTLLFTGCASENQQEVQSVESQRVENQVTEEHQTSEADDVAQSSKILIAYFTLRDNAYTDETIDATTSASVVVGADDAGIGTTEYLAHIIQNKTDGDLHSIMVEVPYPANYDAVVDQNHEEQENDFLPQLKSVVEDMDKYDTIFLGYPIWATSVPQAIRSFLLQ